MRRRGATGTSRWPGPREAEPETLYQAGTHGEVSQGNANGWQGLPLVTRMPSLCFGRSVSLLTFQQPRLNLREAGETRSRRPRSRRGSADTASLRQFDHSRGDLAEPCPLSSGPADSRLSQDGLSSKFCSTLEVF
jgi:hypothetical protein